MATKNANVMARIEPEIKNKAEAILSTLGLSSSGAINLLYRQIIMNNGLPFPVSIPNMPTALEDMSKEEFDSMMKQGLEEVEAKNADLCISCTNSDENTLLSAHLAKEIGAKRTISVVRNIIHDSDNAKFLEKSLNLDYILNSDYLTAEAIYNIIHENKAKKVLISGGHVITLYATKLLLASGHSVTIVERMEERCAYLASVLPNKVNIVQADGSNHEALEKEGLEKYDAFVAMTGRDEVNTLNSLYAKDKGVKTVITKINNDSYVEIVQGLNLEHIVSPMRTTIDIIIQSVEELKQKK